MRSQHRHFFPGGNTCRGFQGFFDSLLSEEKARRIFIVKGGPGMGKSSLMRQVAAQVEDTGEEIEYFHCSGDPDSLDAVAFPSRGALILDGTSPHTVDPRLPGALEETVDLSVCLNMSELRAYRAELRRLFSDMNMRFRRAFRYLEGAQAAMSDAMSVYEAACDPGRLCNVRRELMSLLEGETGGERALFAQAITCKGVISHLDSALEGEYITLDLPWGCDPDFILRPLLHCARARELKREVFMNPLDGRSVAHLNISALSFTTASDADARRFSLAFDSEILKANQTALAFNRAAHDLMLGQAVESLAQAKALHDSIERVYTDAMDFSKHDEIRAGVLKEILGM